MNDSRPADPPLSVLDLLGVSAHAVRQVTALLLIVALIAIAVLTIVVANSPIETEVPLRGSTVTETQETERSAVQMVQVYVEGAFYALTAIGLAVAVYIGAREANA